VCIDRARTGSDASGPFATAELSDPARNLAVRALQAVAGQVGTAIEASIHVHKRIPVGAGLGGGSADAAAVLRTAAALGVEIQPSALLDIAMSLGADVPFQVVGGRATVEGAGERITPLPYRERWIAIAWPGFACSTAEVFAALEPGESSLQQAAYRRYSELAEVELKLMDIGWDARLSGSGSSFYHLCASEREAQERSAAARPLGMVSWAVRTLPAFAQ
jgi:4-diphosphocytidyl-2-C-methyl-D-erythritol kinase